MCRRKVGIVPPEKKLWAKKLLHLFGFLMTSRLNGEYLLNEMCHAQSGKGVESTKGRLLCRKISWPDRSFYPPSLFCFPTPSHTDFALNVGLWATVALFDVLIQETDGLGWPSALHVTFLPGENPLSGSNQTFDTGPKTTMEMVSWKTSTCIKYYSICVTGRASRHGVQPSPICRQ